MINLCLNHNQFHLKYLYYCILNYIVRILLINMIPKIIRIFILMIFHLCLIMYSKLKNKSK
jgi:hypothetical protein